MSARGIPDGSPSEKRGCVRLSGFAVSVLLSAAALAAPPGQKHFATPEEAAEALVTALKADDNAALLDIFGADAKPLIGSGDPIEDKEVRTRFTAAYDDAHQLVKTTETTAILETGKDDWPFPIPLAKEEAGWRFDTEAGKDELINRRIGRNELFTIQSCLAYVDAQREYYARNPEGGDLLHYARKVASSPGKRDGLYWETGEGERLSPLGSLIAEARADPRAAEGRGAPYHGYYYRILTAQGSDAPGGAYDYVVRGKMIGGFAAVAYPATYDVSGVMTFLVNHDGVVFQKDLGPKSAEIARAMTTFNPDDTWTRVDAADQAVDGD